MKILSIHDLEKIRKSAATALRLREESNDKVTENSCGLMMDEIKNGCEQSGASAPQYCKEYK